MPTIYRPTYMRLLLMLATVNALSSPLSGSETPLLCDAINLCPSGVCPEGMELVGSPVRDSTYVVEADRASWAPGELVAVSVRVTKQLIQAKRNAGEPQCECTGRRCPEAGICDCGGNLRRCTISTTAVMERAKYLGLLMYAVKANDPLETKVGGWEVPAVDSKRFATMPGESCEGKAIVQTTALAKRYTETFFFRAPPAGTGAITFRVLLKQGETNGGGFYWPSTSGGGAAPPQAGVTGGDLQLPEAAPTVQAAEWVQGAAGQSCDAACEARGSSCDAASIASALPNATGRSVPSIVPVKFYHVQ